VYSVPMCVQLSRIRSVALLCAYALLVAGSASSQESPKASGDRQIENWFREVRSDIGSARSAIENRILNAEARQAERIGEVQRRLDAVENIESDTRPRSMLQPSEITWSDLIDTLALVGVAIGVWIALRRFPARNEKEDNVETAEWETRKLEAQIREQQLRAHEKEQRWTRISFLFAQAQRLLDDRELSHVLDILERPSRQAPMKNMLGKFGTTALNDEETRLLRALNRLLDRLELVAMAWNDEVVTLQEVGVFLRHVAAMTRRTGLPELTSYCAQHYQLTHALAKACHEFET
jgi:hypothetical protein